MTRSLIIVGVVAVAVVLATARTNAHPTGAVFGPIYRPAPVFVPPSRERSAPETLRVPLSDLHSKSFPEARYPALGSWRAWEVRPGFQWLPANLACSANAGAWAQPTVQANWSDELTSPGFTIGSLAGDPSHSIFASSPSDVTRVAALNGDAVPASSPVSFQADLQPTLCSGSNFAGF